MNQPHAVIIKTNAREAKRLAACVSVNRDFEPEGRRGHYKMYADDEVQALRDAEWLRANGATIVAAF